MTLLAALSLLAVMIVLAALPSASVALVITRAATHGIPNGIAVALGIALGDLVFVALALSGMSLLAESLGAFFAVVKCAGGAYLIWLGVALLRSPHPADAPPRLGGKSTLLTSFLSGFVLTLGDVKAILFYASLFPALVDMERLSGADVTTIVILTISTVFGVKTAYAVASRHMIEHWRMRRFPRRLHTVTGTVLVGTGAYLMAKT